MFFYKILEYFKSLHNRFKRVKIRVVHDEDLTKLLDSIGITEQIKKGEYKCMYCERTVSMDNLWAIKVKEKKIYIVCSNSECLNKIF